MLILGITGGIATGKSTVCQWFKNQGIPVIDADEICHEALKPGHSVYQSVLSSFSNSIPMSELLLPDKSINRRVLGIYIFNHPEGKKKLESFLHPLVKKEMFKKIFFYYISGYSLIAVEIPLLFENKLNRFMSKTLVVYCSEQIQLERLLHRMPHLSKEEALARIHSQWPIEGKCQLADFVINNEKEWPKTELQLQELLRKLKRPWFLTAFWMSLFYVPVASIFYKFLKRIY